MKKVVLVVLAATVVAIVAVVSASAKGPGGSSPTLAVSPNPVVVGNTVTISGCGYPAQSSNGPYLNVQTPKKGFGNSLSYSVQVTEDALGCISATFQVPAVICDGGGTCTVPLGTWNASIRFVGISPTLATASFVATSS